MQIKGAEVQRKTQKDAADIQLRQEEQKRKLTKDMADAQLKERELELDKLEIGIDAKKAGVKMQAEKRRDKDKTNLEASKIITQLKRD